RQTLMQALIKQPCASKRGCGVTSVGARIVSVDGRARGRFEMPLSQRDREGTRQTGRGHSCSVTLDMAASIWFIAARTVISAESIPRPSKRTTIDGLPAGTYGPPALRRRPC